MKGHECHAANDGHDGLAILESSRFDVVLLDLAMPEFSGRDIIDHLDGNGGIRNHLIVSFTASTMSDEDTAYLMNKGIHSIVKKPIDPDALLEYLINAASK